MDAVEKLVDSALQHHRNVHHEGKKGAGCQQEVKPEKLLFYIRQEIATLPVVAHQKNISNTSQERNGVFISYSHIDTSFLEDVRRHFKPFLNQVEFWDDSKILPGQLWKEEIKNAIDKCKVGILLVSTDFLGSQFISTNELPPLLKSAENNGAVILSVILKPCLFEEFNTINQYQTLNPPNKPVFNLDYTEKEELYVNLVRQTLRTLRGS